MKIQIKNLIIALAFITVLNFNASADSFSETFTNTSLNPDLLVSYTNGFSFTLTNGQGIMSKQSGVGNGQVSIRTAFQLGGDFTATVDCGNISLAPSTEAGIAVSTANGFGNVFFFGDTRIVGNMFIGPNQGFNNVFTNPTEATFQITRIGNTLSLQYGTGSGFNTFYSETDASLAVPVNLDVFLVNEYGDTDVHSVWFNNLNIVADQFINVPPPVVNISKAVSLNFSNLLAGINYQLQISTNLNSTFTNYGSPFLATNSSMPYSGYWNVADWNQLFFQLATSPQ